MAKKADPFWVSAICAVVVYGCSDFDVQMREQAEARYEDPAKPIAVEIQRAQVERHDVVLRVIAIGVFGCLYTMVRIHTALTGAVVYDGVPTERPTFGK